MRWYRVSVRRTDTLDSVVPRLPWVTTGPPCHRTGTYRTETDHPQNSFVPFRQVNSVQVGQKKQHQQFARLATPPSRLYYHGTPPLEPRDSLSTHHFTTRFIEYIASSQLPVPTASRITCFVCRVLDFSPRAKDATLHLLEHRVASLATFHPPILSCARLNGLVLPRTIHDDRTTNTGPVTSQEHEQRAAGAEEKQAPSRLGFTLHHIGGGPFPRPSRVTY